MDNSTNNKQQIFNFKKPLTTRLWNSFDIKGRCFLLLSLGAVIMSFDIMKEGLKRTEYLEYKENWLKTHVRDLSNSRYAYLDDEDPPIPLSERTGIEQFKAEFSKIRESLESPRV